MPCRSCGLCDNLPLRTSSKEAVQKNEHIVLGCGAVTIATRMRCWNGVAVPLGIMHAIYNAVHFHLAITVKTCERLRRSAI